MNCPRLRFGFVWRSPGRELSALNPPLSFLKEPIPAKSMNSFAMSFQFSVFSFQRLLVLALCWTSAAAVAPAKVLAADTAAPWRTTLSLGNDGYWKQRIRVVLRNDADQPAEGQALEVKVGKGDGLADLEGAAQTGCGWSIQPVQNCCGL